MGLIVIVVKIMLLVGHGLADVSLQRSASDVCPGSEVIFTCVTDTGELHWQDGVIQTFNNINQVGTSTMLNIFFLKFNFFNGSFVSSTASISSVTSANDGRSITCRDGLVGGNTKALNVDVANVPPATSNVSIVASQSNTIKCMIGEPLRCAVRYNFTIDINELFHNSIDTVNTTIEQSVNLGDLVLCSVFGIDDDGRHGQIQNSTLRYSVLNAVTDFEDTDIYKVKPTDNANTINADVNVTWNLLDVDPMKPPLEYYHVIHNVTNDGTNAVSNTSVAYVVLSGASQNESYFINVSAVNVIGKGNFSYYSFNVSNLLIISQVLVPTSVLVPTTVVMSTTLSENKGLSKEIEDLLLALSVIFTVICIIFLIIIIVLLCILVCKKKDDGGNHTGEQVKVHMGIKNPDMNITESHNL